MLAKLSGNRYIPNDKEEAFSQLWQLAENHRTVINDLVELCNATVTTKEIIDMVKPLAREAFVYKLPITYNPETNVLTARFLGIDHGQLTGLTDDDHLQYLRTDGTRPLSGDWDIGDNRTIQTDKIRARDAAGLALYEDGGIGIFIKDGGNVGINQIDPAVALDVAGDILSQSADATTITVLGKGSETPVKLRIKAFYKYVNADIGQIDWMAYNSVDSYMDFCEINAAATNVTDGAEDSTISLRVVSNGGPLTALLAVRGDNSAGVADIYMAAKITPSSGTQIIDGAISVTDATTISKDVDNANFSAIILKNTNDPLTTEVGQSVSIDAYVRQSKDTVLSDELMGRILFGKTSDFFNGPPSEVDDDSNIQFWVDVNGTLTKVLTLDYDLSATVVGVINASGGNSTNWNTAYGWGNHASGGYLKADGSVVLTGDWDIGNGRMIQADKIRARDSDGLALYGDGGAGLFIADGGLIGIGTTTPAALLTLVFAAGQDGLIIKCFSDTVADAGIIQFLKSHVDTKDTWVQTIDTDLLGGFWFYGVNSGNSGVISAKIDVVQSGAAGASYVASDIIIKVGANTAAPTEKMKIASTGIITIAETTVTKALAGNGTQTVDAGDSVHEERIFNNTFTAGGDWNLYNGATISGGVGNFVNTNSAFLQARSGFVVGGTYIMRFTVGVQTITVQAFGSGMEVVFSAYYAPGEHTVIFVAPTTTIEFQLNGILGSAGATIDEVYCSSVDTEFSPTHLAIYITNTLAWSPPEITLVAGSLPVESIITIVNVAGEALRINSNNSEGIPAVMVENQRFVIFRKCSNGWTPSVAYEVP